MTTRIFNSDMQQIGFSRNLRGLLDHARRVAPVSVTLHERRHPDGLATYIMHTVHSDGSRAVSNWASWQVAADWLAMRRATNWADLKCGGLPEFVQRVVNHNLTRQLL